MAHRANISINCNVSDTLARVVKECSKYDHIIPLLSELHWLPIEARIRHKIAVLTFKAVLTSKPELVSTQTPARDPVNVSLISYMLQTSEPLSEPELFDTLLQQCRTVESHEYCASKHLNLNVSLETFTLG